jgi:glutathione synthase/RimK-type ligase-like ATP-grasp enzyme
MILLISNRSDLTCDYVVRELTARKLNFSRLNTDEFPRNTRGLFALASDGTTIRRIRLLDRDKVIDFDEVSSVLYRRPVPPQPSEAVEDKGVRKFCVDEGYDFLRGLWYSLDCLWISHPEAIRKAEHKVYQLTVASHLGFLIPQTVVTNDPPEVLKFFEKSANGVVVKPLYVGFVEATAERSSRIVYTSLVKTEDLENIDQLVHAPSIFQERVLKQYDVRVTVVGERLFAARIDAELPADVPDWRFLPVSMLNHSHYTLPYELNVACIALVKRLGLQFGAIDFAVDYKNAHYFLEINPNGQWAWLEELLDLPISKAIVDLLSKSPPTKRRRA